MELKEVILIVDIILTLKIHYTAGHSKNVKEHNNCKGYK